MTANSLWRRSGPEIDTSDFESALARAHNAFRSQDINTAFDICDRIVEAHPSEAVGLLATAYEWFKSIPAPSRYVLYVSRYFDFAIKPTDKVLDIGSGHMPFPFATHLADFSVEDNSFGRAGAPAKAIKGLQITSCSVEDMPFDDKQFDFVYCSHVLEHTTDPRRACEELMRVGKRGYIETPTRAKDLWLHSAGVSNHHWSVETVDGILVFREYTPEDIRGIGSSLLMDMHCNPQTQREKAFAALVWLKADLFNTMFMWEDSFEYKIHPLSAERISSRELSVSPQVNTGLAAESAMKPEEPPPGAAADVSMPTSFAIETACACNLRCPECAIGSAKIHRKKGCMTFEQYTVIADKIRPYAKYLYLHLWGEPMLNRDIIRMIRHASQFTRTNISTNGLTLTPVLAEELITSGVSDIIVSIDGITQEVYEKYRVGGDVLSALESLRLLVELNKKHGARVNISPQFVVFKHNQDEMKLFETFCASLGLPTVFKAPYLRDDTVLERADDRRFHRPVFDSVASLRRTMMACGAVRNDFVVLVDGSVVACCHDYDGKTTFGNIFKEDVAQIWNKPAYRTFRTAVTSGNAPAYCVENCMSYFLKKPAAGDTRIATGARETTPVSRHKLKFVQVHTFYPAVLQSLYSRQPELVDQSFEQQVEALLKDGFSAVHMFAPSMRALGYESQLIVGNCAPLQRAWAREHRLEGKKELSSLDVLRDQIEFLTPDVLYISDPITFDSSFVRALSTRPPLVICWRGSAIHPTTDWTEFDVFLSSLTALRKAVLEKGAKHAEHFLPAFPEWISDEIRTIEAQYDVVFSGQFNMGIHRQRSLLLKAVADAAAAKKGGFSCAFYLSTPDGKLPAAVAALDHGPRFGLEMHRALRSGRIALDGYGHIGTTDKERRVFVDDLAQQDTANMRIFEATGSGVFTLTEYRQALERYFTVGKELETYENEKDLLDKIRYYLAHPQKREEIARNGQKRCLSEHSMANRCKEFDHIIRNYLPASSAQPPSGPPLPTRLTSSGRAVLAGQTSHEVKRQEDDIIDKAIAALNEQRNEVALALFSTAIAGLGYPRAVALARLGRRRDACASLESLLQLNPAHEKARILLAELRKQDEPDHGQAVTRELSQGQLEAQKLVQEAARALQDGQPARAFELLNQAKSLKQPVEGIDFTRAILFFQAKQYAAAREAVLEELRYFPANAQAQKLLKEIEVSAPELGLPTMGEAEFRQIYTVIRPYTMLGEKRLYSLYALAKKICQQDIGGNFVECGVAAGGSAALLAWVIVRYSRQTRFLFAFDSFDGMPEPSSHDTHQGVRADRTGWGAGTCAAPESSVREICEKLGVLPIVRIVKGRFEEVLPRGRDKVGMISLLHLDGDWYESTKAILANLYDRVVNGGLFQVDDYGFWDGCKKAIHEFEKLRGVTFALNRIDDTGVWFERPDNFPVNGKLSGEDVEIFKKNDPVRIGVVSEMSANERFQMHYAVRKLVPDKAAPVRFLEIGSYSGASMLLAYASLRARGVACEGFAIEPAGTRQFYAILGQLNPHIKHLKMFSHQAAPVLKEIFDKDGNFPLFMFIDGDHFYDGVQQDILDYYPLCAPGGLMLFHDFLPPLTEENRECLLFPHDGREPGVRRACEELMEKQYGCEVVDIPLLFPTDPSQTQAHFPIIPGVYSTLRAYRKPEEPR